MSHRPHLTILGMPGSGKTTVGRLVADRAGIPFLDGDEWLRDTAGRSAGEIAGDDGVPALHRLEAEVAGSMLAADEPAVVAPAASVLDDPATVDDIRGRSWLIVVLDADPGVLTTRTTPDDHRRPMPPEESSARWAGRRPVAMGLADVVLDAATPPEDLAERIAGIRAC